MKTIKLPCYEIVIKIGRSREIESNLHYSVTDEIEDRFEDGDEFNLYEAAVGALETLILAHAYAGVNVKSPAYVKGIKSAVEDIDSGEMF